MIKLSLIGIFTVVWFRFPEIMQRMLKYGVQNILIYKMPSYVIIYRSYKQLKWSVFDNHVHTTTNLKF